MVQKPDEYESRDRQALVLANNIQSFRTIVNEIGAYLERTRAIDNNADHKQVKELQLRIENTRLLGELMKCFYEWRISSMKLMKDDK